MYSKLTKENKILGLEMIDFLFLALIYLLVFLVSRNLIVNFGIILIAYFSLLAFKRKKPARYTQSLLRFLILPGHYSVTREGME